MTAATQEIGETPKTAVAVRPPAPTSLAPEAHFASLVDLAETFIKSGFMPKSVRTAPQAVALILTGREMGLGPMASIRSIAIVDGKPVVAADLQLGLFKRAGGHATFEQLDERGAVLRLKHPNGDEHTERFSLADAEKAGLAGKDNWRKYPKAMLRSRVITAGLKSVGFEPLAGVYDPEEMDTTPIGAAAAPVVEERPGNVDPDGVVSEAPVNAAPSASAPPASSDDGAVRIPGGPTKWGGHGGKAITDPSVPDGDLTMIRDWFQKKDAEKNRTLVAAMTAELDRRMEAAEREREA